MEVVLDWRNDRLGHAAALPGDAMAATPSMARLQEFCSHGIDPEPILFWADHADPQCLRNRHQAVETFPVVAQVIANYPRVPINMEIAAVIDRGDPLIDALASILGVKKNSVRFLRGKGHVLLGAGWMDHPHDLFHAVDLIPAACRPNTLREWQMMWEFWVGCGMVTNDYYSLHPKTTTSGAMQQHMFIGLCVKGFESSTKRLAKLWHDHWFRLSDLRDYFRFVGEWCRMVAEMHLSIDIVRQAAESRVRDELLIRYSAIELIQQSQRWHQQFEGVAKTGPGRESSADPDWPGLPGLPLHIAGLTVYSLTNAWQLQLEGQRLQHCVGTYHRPCLYGESHIISIRNQDGESLSTAEICLPTSENEQCMPSVIQHRGLANSDPSGDCAAALNAVLKMLGSDGMHGRLMELQEYHVRRRVEIAVFMRLEVESVMATRMGEIMHRVLPDYDQALDWLIRSLAEEDNWYRYRNSQIGDELQKIGLDDELTYDRADEFWRDTGVDYFYDTYKSPRPLLGSLTR